MWRDGPLVLVTPTPALAQSAPATPSGNSDTASTWGTAARGAAQAANEADGAADLPTAWDAHSAPVGGEALSQGDQQLALQLVTKGRFEKSEPNLHEGVDLDIPTFLRRNMELN